MSPETNLLSKLEALYNQATHTPTPVQIETYVANQKIREQRPKRKNGDGKNNGNGGVEKIRKRKIKTRDKKGKSKGNNGRH